MPIQGIAWLGAVVLLFAVEAATVGLVSIWFGVGALAGLVTSFFTDNVWIQIVCLLAVRPLAVRYTVPKKTATNADRTIGAQGVVVETIDNIAAQGQVKVRGAVWSARTAADGTVLPEGTHVQVLRIEGVKAIVAPIPAQVQEP